MEKEFELLQKEQLQKENIDNQLQLKDSENHDINNKDDNVNDNNNNNIDSDNVDDADDADDDNNNKSENEGDDINILQQQEKEKVEKEEDKKLISVKIFPRIILNTSSIEEIQANDVLDAASSKEESMTNQIEVEMTIGHYKASATSTQFNEEVSLLQSTTNMNNTSTISSTTSNNDAIAFNKKQQGQRKFTDNEIKRKVKQKLMKRDLQQIKSLAKKTADKGKSKSASWDRGVKDKFWE